MCGLALRLFSGYRCRFRSEIDHSCTTVLLMVFAAVGILEDLFKLILSLHSLPPLLLVLFSTLRCHLLALGSTSVAQ